MQKIVHITSYDATRHNIRLAAVPDDNPGMRVTHVAHAVTSPNEYSNTDPYSTVLVLEPVCVVMEAGER